MRGGAWGLVSKIITGLSNVVISIILAKLLSIEDVGGYFLIFSLLSLSVLASQMGANQSIIKFIPESLSNNHPERVRAILNYSFLLISAGSAFILLCLNFLVDDYIFEYFLKSTKSEKLIIVISIWIIITTFQKYIIEVFRSFYCIHLSAIFGGVIPNLLVIFCLLTFSFLEIQINLKDVIYVMIVSNSSALLLSAFYLKRTIIKLPKADYNEVSIVKFMSVSFPLLVNNLLIYGIMQIDIWISGYFLSTGEVALYGAGFRVASLLMLITTVLYSFLPPLIAELNAKGEIKKLTIILRLSALVNTIVVLPLLIVLVFYPSFILEVTFGVNYTAASTIVTALSVGFFVNIITGIRGYVLMMTGHEKLMIFISIVGAVLNICFCIFGALNWGNIGIAIGAMTGMIMQCTMELFVVRKVVGIWTVASLPHVSEIKSLRF